MQETSGKAELKLDLIRGKKILSACSSLQNFSIAFESGEFDSGVGLRIDAVTVDEESRLEMTVVEASALPKAADAVCSVDWSWIYSSAVKQISSTTALLRLELDPVGPLVVSAGMWQGKPFLSFQPFRAPTK
jgi:hypothetical protein